MNENHRETISLLFSFSIIVLAALVVREFLIPLAWAGIIAIATWPVYSRIHRLFKGNDVVASTVWIVCIGLIIAVPVSWLLAELARDVHVVTTFLIKANTQGVPLPLWIDQLPWGKQHVASLWMDTLGQPHGLSQWFTDNRQSSVAPLSALLKSLGAQVAHRSVILGFTLLCLFFFYKDGEAIQDHINGMGRYFFHDRWILYSANLPGAIKATVNGLVLVGIGVGIVMGLCYAIAGVPAPALFGALTGVLAIIPFAVPIAFVIVAALLILNGHLISAIVIVLLGTVLMFIVDHFVRPVMISGATRLPFLAVLFGILGGVKTFGLVGLFLGPISMVLFLTLWHEADIFHTRR